MKFECLDEIKFATLLIIVVLRGLDALDLKSYGTFRSCMDLDQIYVTFDLVEQMICVGHACHQNRDFYGPLVSQEPFYKL